MKFAIGKKPLYFLILWKSLYTLRLCYFVTGPQISTDATLAQILFCFTLKNLQNTPVYKFHILRDFHIFTSHYICKFCLLFICVLLNVYLFVSVCFFYSLYNLFCFLHNCAYFCKNKATKVYQHVLFFSGNC